MSGKSGCCGGCKDKTSSASKPQGKTTGMNIAEPQSKKMRKPGAPIEGKIVLLGESGVGKSSIAQRFCNDRFDEAHDVTIGGAYLQKTVLVPSRVEDGKPIPEQQVKLHIWDTGGSEKFRSMISLYYRDAVGAIICYDVTDDRTFAAV